MVISTVRRIYARTRVLEKRPRILCESGKLPIGSASRTFVLVCGPGFDQSVPSAGTTCRMGWCAAFERLGIPYLLLSTRDLARRLPNLPDPICWISGFDYSSIDDAGLAALRRTPHMVWVDTWFTGEESFYKRNDLPLAPAPSELRRRILSSDPNLLFTISPEQSFDFYRSWIDAGGRLVSLPLACDTQRYASTPVFSRDFSRVEIAFVGGYWAYKARQLDRYLRPYQDRLTVFGYTSWPYAGYGGQLPEEHESALYNQARVSPAINEPHVELMGIDLNERVFKVLGSGGVAVTDAVPGYREWFAEDELLMPRSLAEFREVVDILLVDTAVRDRLAIRGCEAVHARHTYVHRALAALVELNIPMPIGSMPGITSSPPDVSLEHPACD